MWLAFVLAIQLTLSLIILLVNYFQVMSSPSYLFYVPKNQLRKIFSKSSSKLSTEVMIMHNEKILSLIDGVAMGNILGPTLLNWSLKTIEKKKKIKLKSFFYPSLHITTLHHLVNHCHAVCRILLIGRCFIVFTCAQ